MSLLQMRGDPVVAPGARRGGGSYKCDGISMDSLITAAGRALAAGDPLGALKRIALRDDPPALALRGIAMAQLGDLGACQGAAAKRRACTSVPAKPWPAHAASSPKPKIALVSRDLSWAGKALDSARPRSKHTATA